jgi:hypothetical protein
MRQATVPVAIPCSRGFPDTVALNHQSAPIFNLLHGILLTVQRGSRSVPAGANG